MDATKVLKGHDLFRTLGLEKAFEINKISSVKRYMAGQTIFAHKSVANHVYMLMTGSVNLQLPSKDKSFNLVISKIEKGELFGFSPLLDSPRYTASAECVKDTELLAIEAKPFRELLRDDSLIGFNIMSHIAHIYFNRYINVLRNLQEIGGQISMIK